MIIRSVLERVSQQGEGVERGLVRCFGVMVSDGNGPYEWPSAFSCRQK
jgi:hypothetical protein